jgi:hypothetical protein
MGKETVIRTRWENRNDKGRLTAKTIPTAPHCYKSYWRFPNILMIRLVKTDEFRRKYANKLDPNNIKIIFDERATVVFIRIHQRNNIKSHVGRRQTFCHIWKSTVSFCILTIHPMRESDCCIIHYIHGTRDRPYEWQTSLSYILSSIFPGLCVPNITCLTAL